MKKPSTLEEAIVNAEDKQDMAEDEEDEEHSQATTMVASQVILPKIATIERRKQTFHRSFH